MKIYKESENMITDKDKIIECIKAYEEPNKEKRNLMGCSESWYDYIYALKITFTIEELEAMSQKEIDNLIQLACNIQEGLW